MIESDPSKSGWDAVWKDKKTGGRWTQESHINYLGSFLALQCLMKDLRNVGMLVWLDNRTAIAYINKMGVQHCPTYEDLPYRFGNGALPTRSLFMQSTCLARRTPKQIQSHIITRTPSIGSYPSYLPSPEQVVGALPAGSTISCHTMETRSSSYGNWCFYCLVGSTPTSSFPFSLIGRTFTKIQLEYACLIAPA